jgi:hypothetical protein
MNKDIYNQLTAVAELFGGYAAHANKMEGVSELHDKWIEGRKSAFALVQDHCERMAAIYKEEEK